MLGDRLKEKRDPTQAEVFIETRKSINGKKLDLETNNAIEDVVRILMSLRERYESHHRCRFTLESINAAIYFSARYISDRHLLEKAIDLIDEDGGRAHLCG
ncbi:hypothetical protein KSP40_PGU010647 [Platanthera guangdongensis]|uniref:ClpA/ClpB AAA lid domain-containing protein n=1 Tax=Platanthera guangdongensis TaxID=2320717 RepID=A0ABR2M0S9_9ASPA